MAKKEKYPPELTERIFVSALYALSYGEDATKDRIFERRLAKLKLLIKHFEIDENGPNPFLILAFELARRHVKGFEVASSPPSRAGRPRSWHASQKFELFKDVAALKEGGLSVNAACQALTKRKSSQWHGKSWRTLANLWRETKKEVDGFESLTAGEKLTSEWGANEIERLRQALPPEVHQKSRRE